MEETKTRKVQILRDSVAQKIAAGEVIDRPFSLLRELIDNSIDAGSSRIECHVDGGGVTLIKVIDDGAGMAAEDLDLCIRPHATSKIREVTDLDTLSSLGFRGEALASIAACSRLSIQSGTDKNEPAHKITVTNGKVRTRSADKPRRGTVISAADLFYSIPARRKFLKRPSAETTQCVNTFLEKALPFPEIEFKMVTDGRVRFTLPPQRMEDRVRSAFPGSLKYVDLKEVTKTQDDLGVTLVMAPPSYFRRDRRMIHTYVNNRRISEYALTQAVEYGYSEYLPGGSFPAVFCFLTVDPSQADFNIHPAKREVRFQDMKRVHRFLTQTIRDALREYRLTRSALPMQTDLPELTSSQPRPQETTSPSFPGSAPSRGISQNPSSRTRPLLKTKDRGPEDFHQGRNPTTINSRTVVPKGDAGGLTAEEGRYTAVPLIGSGSDMRGFDYKGTIFDLFLLVEADEALYIIDQHAAHERILYEKFSTEGKPQPLLFPLVLDGSESESLQKMAEILKEWGIILSRSPGGTWEIREIPGSCAGSEDLIAAFLMEFQGETDDLRQKLFATMSCKAAVKQGDILDRRAAEELIAGVFHLKNARCPHGRPIWHKITRTELIELIGRTH